MEAPAVEISGVTKRFDDVVAVDDVDLVIDDGEFEVNFSDAFIEAKG